MRKNILSFIVGTILLVSLNACGQKESIERITASATWDTYYENIQEITLSSISDFKYLYDSTAASGFFTFFFLCGGVGARLP